MPQAAVRHGRARQSSETGPCGDKKKGPVGTGPAGSVFGKIRFIKKPRVQDYDGRQGAKRTVETELKVTQSALDMHMGCTPFVKD